MKMQWFVLHCLSGQEFKIKHNIDRRIQIEEVGDLVEEILIPTEKVSETKLGKKREMTRKFFPGYVLGKVALYNDDNSINERTWHFIQDTPGIIGFIGGEKPAPLRQSEVESILHQIEDKKAKVTPKVNFGLGELVKIIDGPFENFTGPVMEITDKIIKVDVDIFGRKVTVECEYWQVEKIS